MFGVELRLHSSYAFFIRAYTHVKFLFALYQILSEFNFYVRVRTYENRVTGMQPLVLVKPLLCYVLSL